MSYVIWVKYLTHLEINMKKKIYEGMKGIREAIRYFFIDLLKGESVKVQLLWVTAFCWSIALFRFVS